MRPAGGVRAAERGCGEHFVASRCVGAGQQVAGSRQPKPEPSMSLSSSGRDRSADHVPPPGHPERVERAQVMREVVEAMAGPRRPRPRAGAGHARADRTGPRARLRGPPRIRCRPPRRPRPRHLHVARLLGCGRPRRRRRHHGRRRRPWGQVLQSARVRRRSRGGVRARAAAGAPRAARPGDGVLPPQQRRDRASLTRWTAGLQRVAVVDYDVHHGNGTQWAFYDDPRVLVVSLHQHPFYPQTGSAGECGVGRGRGVHGQRSAVRRRRRRRLPAAAGAGRRAGAARRIAPQLLVLDAGFDAHDRDPLAHMHVTTDGFRRMAGCLRDGGRALLRGAARRGDRGRLQPRRARATRCRRPSRSWRGRRAADARGLRRADAAPASWPSNWFAAPRLATGLRYNHLIARPAGTRGRGPIQRRPRLARNNSRNDDCARVHTASSRPEVAAALGGDRAPSR